MLRAANISNVSARGAMISGPRSRTILRTRSARGVPPGSRVTRAVMPREASHSLTSWATVDLPAPSMPSRVMKRPRLILKQLYSLGNCSMRPRLSLALHFGRGRRPVSHNATVLLGAQMPEIAFHRSVVLFQGFGEMMSAIAGACGHEIDFPGLLRSHRRENGFTSGQRNRGRRQSFASIRVVGGISGEVPSSDTAVVAGTQSVDHRGISLQPHPFTQPSYERAGDLWTLRRQTGFFLDDGRQYQRLVRGLEWQISSALLPRLIESALHGAIGQSQDLSVGGLCRESIGV